MSIAVDKRTLEIAVKYDKTRQEINKVTDELKEQNRELKKLEAEKKAAEKKHRKNPEAQELKEITQRYEEQRQKVIQLERKKTELRKSLGIEGLSLRELRDEIKRYGYQLDHLTPGTKAFNETKAHLDALKARMKELRGQAETAKFSLSKLADGFNRFAALGATAIASVTGLSMTIRKATQAYADMEEEMAQVQKYTGWTTEQVHELNEEFKQMNTRTQREELNQLAGDAGKLGITGKQALMEFVDAADKVRVALGDDLGDDAVKNIGKLAMMFGEDKTKGLRGAMLATGSAVNELAQNSTAAAGYIVDFTARMAGVGGQVGLTQAQIMGFASVLDQNMQQLETSSTVLSQLLTKMYQQPARFASLAGLQLEEFTNLLKTDANNALLQFLSTMQAKGGFDSLAPMFEEMKLNGTRATGVLSVLATKLGDVKTAQELATGAYAEGTSVINEFNVQNNTVQARIDKNVKRFKDLTIELGEKLLPVVEHTITAGSMAIKLLKMAVDFISKWGVTIVTVSTALAFLTGLRYADIAAAKLQTLWTDKIRVGLKKLWETIMANPWGALAVAMAAVVGVVIDLIRRNQQLKKEMSDVEKIRQDAISKLGEEKVKIELLVKAARDEKLSLEERHKAIDKLNAVIPNYNGQLDDTTKKYKENKKALDDYLGSLMKQYEIEGAKDMLRELGRQMAETQTELTQARENQQGAGGMQGGVNRWSRYNATESMFLAQNTQRANKAVSDAEKRLDTLTKRSQMIAKTFGVDALSDVGSGGGAAEIDNGGGGGSTGGSGSGGGGGSKDDPYQKDTEALQKAQRQRLNALKESLTKGEITEEEYRQRSKQLDMQNLAEKLALQEKYGKDTSDTQGQILDKQIALSNERYQEQQKQMNGELSALQDAHNADMAGLAKMRLDGIITNEEEYRQRELEAEIDFQLQRIAIIKKYGGDTAQAEAELVNIRLRQQSAEKREALEAYEKELREYAKSHTASETNAHAADVNQAEYDAGLISFKEYQDRKTEILEESEQIRHDIRQQFVNQANELLQSAQSYFNAMQGREEARVDAKYKKLIAAAKKQGKDTTKLEEQQEAEKSAIKKKYAQKEFRMNVLKILADTATGIAALWKNPGYPWAIPLTALVAAQGAMQLATAKAQQEQAAGLYGGGFSEDAEGFTADGNPKDVAGMIPVHKREFVINHKALQNPAVMEVAKTIDSYQKAGRPDMINSTALLRAAAMGGGLADGGFSQGTGSSTSSAAALGLTAEQSRVLEDCREYLRIISEDRGVTIRDVRRKIREEELMETRASR